MSSPNPDDSRLLIRCPSCGQRFKVDEDLKGRTVECGGCEHRFRIDDEVTVRGKRVYPGERSGENMNRFQRVPMSGGESHIGVQPMRYGNQPDPAVMEPASPQRIIAGLVGVCGIIIMALLLMFGGSRGGLLDGMEFPSRMVMAGFASFLGTLLLVYANPKAKTKSLFFGVLLSVGLLAVPFFFRAGSDRLPEAGSSAIAGDRPIAEPEVELSPEEAATAALREQLATGRLEEEINKLAAENNGQKAIGLWLRGLSADNKFLVRDYIQRMTHADTGSILYPRSDGDYLMVVTRITMSLQEMSEIAGALGTVEHIYPELSVVEIAVKNENFVEGSMEKMTNKEDPAFYGLNKRELESIDLERVKRAVQRLSNSEPKIYRADITQKLIALLKDEAVDFKGSVSSALAIWSETPGPAGEAALGEVRKLLTAGKEIPREIVSLIVKEKNPDIIPVLDQLWLKSPTTWESIYADFGPPVEDTVLKRFPETQGSVKYSSVRILGRVGGADSLPVLQGALVAADSELRVLVEQASRSIRGRMGR